MIWKQAGAFELKAGVAQSPSPRGNEDMKKNHKKSRPSERLFLNLAVGQGFVPREPLGSTVFKSILPLGSTRINSLPVPEKRRK